MSDDFVNDPFDEAPVHVLDADAEPDDAPDEALDAPGPSSVGDDAATQ